jgi:hypothetical protein
MFLWSLFATFSPNLIGDSVGSFENVGQLFRPNDPTGAAVMRLDNQAHLPPGWIAQGTQPQQPAVLWMSKDLHVAEVKAKKGELFVDLSGESSTVFGGLKLAEPVATELNQLYQVSFALGTWENDDITMCGPTMVVVSLLKGDLVVKEWAFIHPRRKNAGMFWTRHEYVFRAKSNPIGLQFYAQNIQSLRTAAGASTNSTLIAIDEVGIRKMTVLGRVLDFISKVLEHLRLIKTHRPSEPQPAHP